MYATEEIQAAYRLSVIGSEIRRERLRRPGADEQARVARRIRRGEPTRLPLGILHHTAFHKKSATS